jgi:ribonuclease E
MAKRKIVISEYDNIAALMEDDRAVEFIIHRGDMLLGDVYLATVENILPSIDAAFVNVGGDKMGFLHSSDVPGKGDLKDRLEPKQQLVVQIMKEPTGHKGPRVSTSISLPGRFLVMMPESKGISISRKIMEPAERSRLKSVVSLIKPPGVGVIIRTEASNQKESDITEDFETLLERWQNIVSMADTATPPTLLYRDQDLLYRVIREAVTEDVTDIVVDSAFGQQRAQQLLQNWNLDKGVKVTHYQGAQPILVGAGVDKEIKLALQTKVPLPSGGYLYIQPTEALTVIDVNSGKFTSLQSQAETIKLTNLEACKEIARQLRLRNIGGMIIVDFIDMESRANQLQVLQTFENELMPDKAKPQMGQLSDLGLVEMTRHRQGQSLSEIFTRRCHTCGGTGHALEEFSWMHSGDGGDGRGRQAGRNKLPVRQPNRLQQLPKPAASLSRGREKGRVALGNLADAASGQRKEPPSQVTPGNILLNSLAERKARPGTAEVESLAELLGEKIYKAIGVRLASAAKLAYLPPSVNSVLSRIHPKANDIVSLVHSIEATSEDAGSGRSHFEDGDEADETPDEDGGDEADDEFEESPDAAEEAVRSGKSAESAESDEALPVEREPFRRRVTAGAEAFPESEAEPTEERRAVGVAEAPAEEEEPVEKPRRGRARRAADVEVALVEALPSIDIPTADEVVGDDDEFDDVSDDSADSDDELSSDEDGDATVAAKTPALTATQAKRRRGRPAKRSIKKPPAKR